MELEKDSTSKHGGARAGAGRPKGTGNKITAKELLDQCQKTIGIPFAQSLMEGYRDAIHDDDRKHRVIYEKIIVDKVASTMFDVEVDDTTEIVSAKQLAFAEAIKQIINKDKDDDNASN
jgi:hypothetical protein